ncbi:MAG: BTAD domain-containing putative transcriptional regulator [Sporichthyaceae bacterium]
MPAQGAAVFGLLGELVVTVDGVVRAVSGHKVRLLLAMLAAEPGRLVRTDVLVEELWGSSDGGDEAGRLQAVVSRARRALAGGCTVEFRSGGYALAGASTDVGHRAELARLGAQAAADGEYDVAEGHLRAALALRRGPAYAEFADREFFRLDAARLDEVHVQLTESRGDVLLSAGRAAEAVGLLEPHVAAHPFREEAAARLMTALHRCGRRADALAVYRDVRARIAEELGLDPGPELRRVEALVLEDSPELVVPDRGLSHPERYDRRPQETSSGSGGGPAHNLPNLGGRFVGRRQSSPRCRSSWQAIGSSRCGGPGGAGKTRLAVEVATRLVEATGSIERFADGVWFASLASVESPAQVVPAVMAAMGMLGAPEGDANAMLASKLRSRQLLVVLDNCEHLLDESARLVHALLTEAPGVRVLVTSREPLLLPDECVWSARSLSLPAAGADLAAVRASDAGAFFLDRVALAAPSFEAGAPDGPIVAEICRRLEGIPLAIELAAARVRALGLRGVAAGLDDQFSLLTGGHRSADSRHRTMRAAIDWSAALATPPERELLACLSVFPGSFDVPAAAAVAGVAQLGAAAEMLAQLVERSMVATADHGPGRYRMLEPIRQYAAELANDDLRVNQLRARHARHFAERIGRDVGAADHRIFNATGASQRVDRVGFLWRGGLLDSHNYRAAVEWSLAAEDPVAVRLAADLVSAWAAQDDPADDPPRWLEQGHALAERLNLPESGMLLAGLAWFTGDPALAARAVECTAESGDDEARIVAAWAEANILLRSDPRQGRERLLQVLDAAAAGAVKGVTATCHQSLVYVDLSLGDVAAARERSERLVAGASHNNPLGAMHWGCHALALVVDGDHRAAEAAAQRALSAAEASGLPTMRALAFLRAATVSSLAGQWPLAVERLIELVALLRRMSTRRWVNDTLQIAAIALAASERPQRVALLLDAAAVHDWFNETPGGTLPQIAEAMARARSTAEGRAQVEPPVDIADRDAVLRLTLEELRAAAGRAS